MPKKTTYRSSGVDIDAGNRFIELIKPIARSTQPRSYRNNIGLFAGSFPLSIKGYKNPILLSSADGVGTKLKIAFMSKKLDTVGIDLVAMNVNDIVTSGAKPLFFLDYFSTSRLRPEEDINIVKGIAKGCREAGCILLGGETAELPGFYKKDEFDLAGFAVGIVDKKDIIDGKNVRPGDVLIGIESNGLHSNGYSLARKVLLGKNRFKLEDKPKPLGKTLGEELLKPTRIYVNSVLSIIKKYEIKSVSHITGGGLLGNIPRVIPGSCSIQIDSSKIKLPPIMKLIMDSGNIEIREMYRTFNCGIGMVLVVPATVADKVIKFLVKYKNRSRIIGEIVKTGSDTERVEFI